MRFNDGKKRTDSQREREEAISKIIQALEKHPEGLGVRDLHKESVGRGKPKKIYKLTKKGIAHF